MWGPELMERNNRQSFWVVDEVCDEEICIKKNSQHHHQWFPRSGPAYAAGVHDPTDLGVAETSAAIAGLCAPCMHTHTNTCMKQFRQASVRNSMTWRVSKYKTAG